MRFFRSLLSASPGSGIIGLFLLSWATAAQAAEPVSKSRFGGVAIGGKDTVAYHSLARDPQDKALSGAKKNIVKWKGATWRFVSAESAALFKAEPDRYSPAYNGYCANALSLGKGLLKTDGTHWEILGDKLYLFYAAKGRQRWVSSDSQQALIDAADREWGNLIR